MSWLPVLVRGWSRVMPSAKRQMALTAELVASVARVVEDAGPSPGAVYLTDTDYDAIVRDMLAQAPAGDLWLFGYGSLLWKLEANSRCGSIIAPRVRWARALASVFVACGSLPRCTLARMALAALRAWSGSSVSTDPIVTRRCFWPIRY